MKTWLNKLFARELTVEVKDKLANTLADVRDEYSEQTFNDWLVDARQGVMGMSLVFEVPYPAQSLWSNWREKVLSAATESGLNVVTVDFV